MLNSKQHGLKILFFAMVIILVLTACGKSEDASSTGDYPNPNLLADVEWIADNLDNDKIVIIDARSKGYEEGHIPGAVSLNSGKINDPDNPVSGFLLGAEGMTEAVSGVGVNQDSTIIIYDGGNSLSASRVFYALELYGLKDQVKLLNGGYAAWLTAGKDVSFEAPVVTAGNFKAEENEDLVTDLNEISDELGNENVVFLDTRSKEEYEGTELRKNANGGHVPGAVHREWTESLEKGDDGIERFKSADALKEEFSVLGATEGKTIVPYCQTNVRGAHTYFTLRLLGYSDVRPYEGSWAEYGNTEGTQIEL